MRLWAAVVVLVVTGSGAAARAEDEGRQASVEQPASPAARSDPRGQWYGWQTGLADAATLGLFVGAFRRSSADMLSLAELSYGFGAPAVHLAHHRTGAGAVSLGLRMLGPLTGAILGLALGGCAPDTDSHLPIPNSCQARALGGGLLVGMTVPVLVDLITSYDPPAVPALASRRGSSPSVVPTLAPMPGGASAGLVGTF